MRISTVARDRYADHSNELAHMHRFRATGFQDCPERNVTTSEPIEFNHCDQLDSAYVRAVTNDKRDFGCAPHLSAVRPTILKPTGPQHSAEGSFNATEWMIESSQVCIDTSLRPGRGGPRFHVATLTVFASIIEWSMADGCDQILTANERPFERFLNCTGSSDSAAKRASRDRQWRAQVRSAA
ncbi:acyl-homoserine-lactone synthase [Agrobacterium sp. LAD9]|uniref:acyl-homoserine-lactone synthase n=1 Tax=Agrobacterium sp. LAD9 TaxID=2055153 RepID=UPI000D1E65DC|nr:acyl-homoserine-lactone synthase [Agrobacterium sp. LAD9]